MDLLMLETELDPIYGNAAAPPPTGEYFAENFWGEKYSGFNVLYHNMKHGQISVKEFQEFVRESAGVEELYAKHLTKLANKAANCTQLGSFYPVMDVFKTMAEKISSCHMDIVLKLQDVAKELSKYLEEQKNKHKQSKDGFNGTLDALQNLQTATNAVMKSREKYNLIRMEEERLKAAGTSQQKELEKAAAKSKKAAEEYKNLVGKHALSRHRYEERMYNTARDFQRIEKGHLMHMKSVVDTYIQSFQNAHVLVNQVHQELRRQVNESTVDRLLQQYAEQKGTGTDRPVTIVFEEFRSDNSSTGADCLVPTMVENGTPNQSSLSDSSSHTGTVPPISTKTKKETSGRIFGGIRRRKAKPKTDPSTNSSSSKDSKDAESIESPGKDSQYQVDEEGYTIRPDSPVRSEKNGFRFSSDSDSDSDSDDASRRKIKVHIKPIEAAPANSTGSNIETLNMLAKNLTLGHSPSMKARSSSESRTQRSDSLSSQVAKSDKMTNGELLQLFSNESGNTSSVFRSRSTRSTSIGSVKANEELDLFSNFDASKLSTNSGKGNTTSSKKGPAPPIPALMSESHFEMSLDKILASSEVEGASDVSPSIPPRPPKPVETTPPLIPRTRPENLSVANLAKFAAAESTPRSSSAPILSSGSLSSLSSMSTGTPTHQPADNPVPGFASISRGPSPLTLSHSDIIPIAIAFTETVNAYFKGDDSSRTLAKTTGEMHISFPAGITHAFTSNPNLPILSFKIATPSLIALSNVSHDKTMLRRDQSNNDVSSCSFTFDMPSLVAHVKRMTEKDPNSPHYNIHIISYVLPSTHQTLPLHLSSSWQCESSVTNISVNYKYNSAATSGVLQSLGIIVPVQGSVTDVQSTPTGSWNSDQNQLCWKLPTKISSEVPTGTLQGTLAMSSGPSKPSAMAAQFLSEGNTLSGVEFQLSGTGYRTSLVKKRFISGKYLCENV